MSHPELSDVCIELWCSVSVVHSIDVWLSEDDLLSEGTHLWVVEADNILPAAPKTSSSSQGGRHTHTIDVEVTDAICALHVVGPVMRFFHSHIRESHIPSSAGVTMPIIASHH